MFWQDIWEVLLVLTALAFCVLAFTTQAERSRYRMSSSKFTAVNVRICFIFKIRYCLGGKPNLTSTSPSTYQHQERMFFVVTNRQTGSPSNQQQVGLGNQTTNRHFKTIIVPCFFCKRKTWFRTILFKNHLKAQNMCVDSKWFLNKIVRKQVFLLQTNL